MSYRIEFAEEASRRFRALDAETALLVAEKIDRLTRDLRLGVMIQDGPLGGRMLYAFVIEPGPRVLRIGVLYLFGDDEETIHVTTMGALAGDDDRIRIVREWPPR